MTEVSSTGETAGAESSAGFRRSAVPAPPRPPEPLDDVAVPGVAVPDVVVPAGAVPAGPYADGGPATSAMAAVGGGLLDGLVHERDPLVEPGYARDSSYTGLTRPVPPMTVTGAVPPPPKVRKDRRPQVTVRGPRRAKLVIRRVDPWSVMKFSFLFAVCLAIMFVVSASAMLSLLRTMHVFDNINSVLASATSPDSTTTKGFRVDPTMHDVRLWAAILGAVNALLFTALATLGAFLYNLISMLVGGVEVTLAERD